MGAAIDTGSRLGHYEIRSLLGAGGMGEVYLAQDTSELERTVALKVLPQDVAADQQRMQRFIQEARTVSALNHPNILTIYEFGQDDSVRFIAAEYIDGVTLRQHLSERRLRLFEALDIAIQIAAALDAAHEAKVVHRDIKPENVMIRRRDHIIKVLDFGLAKLTLKPEATEREPVDTETETKILVNTNPGTLMGTALYMSPEQSEASAEIDHRTDIWSLGVVLYEMVAGHVPFTGKDIHRQIIAIQENDPAPLSQYAEGVPERLEEIVQKALAKDPGERYQTAKDLLIDLRNLRRKLDVDAELDRTLPPELRSTIGVAKQSSGQSIINAPQKSTQSLEQARSTSSAKYVAGSIKRHRRGIIIALACVLIAAAITLAYFYLNRTDSIAVLPLTYVNTDPQVMADPDRDYLADGLTESIINSLSQLHNLKVVARSSVFRYKGRDTDVQTIGRELGVRTVMTGRIIQRGDVLTISVELVDVSDNKQIWGEKYERKLSDLLFVQKEIAREITENLRLRLTGEEQSRANKDYTQNADAYQLYLKGRFYWNKRSKEATEKGIEQFQQAIAIDPNYALAYVGLSDSYQLLSAYNYGDLPPQDVYPKAKWAAEKALAIDNTLSEAHTSLASIKTTYELDWAGAEEEFKRAIALNPNYPTAHQWYSRLLMARGRFDEAKAEIERAHELDPLSLVINSTLGDPYYFQRQFDQAIEQSRKTLELDPNFNRSHKYLQYAFEEKGMYDDAIAELEKQGEKPETVAALRKAYAASGARGYWQKFLEIRTEEAKQKYVPSFELAVFYAKLGDKDRAFELLDKAYEEKYEALMYLKVHPRFDNLRSDPRFTDLLRRLGLTT